MHSGQSLSEYIVVNKFCLGNTLSVPKIFNSILIKCIKFCLGNLGHQKRKNNLARFIQNNNLWSVVPTYFTTYYKNVIVSVAVTVLGFVDEYVQRTY